MKGTPPSDYELLRSIYRRLDMRALLADYPGLTRKDMDEFFKRMASVLKKQKKTSPQRRRLKGVIIHTDGGSRGNPGPAGYGVVLLDDSGRTLSEKSRFIGRATSNEAEYRAAIAGLEAAREVGASEVLIRTDSELLARQLSGAYRVKSRRLMPLFLRAREILDRFDSWRVEHVPREANDRADHLANRAIDRAAARPGASLP